MSTVVNCGSPPAITRRWSGRTAAQQSWRPEGSLCTGDHTPCPSSSSRLQSQMRPAGCWPPPVTSCPPRPNRFSSKLTAVMRGKGESESCLHSCPLRSVPANREKNRHEERIFGIDATYTLVVGPVLSIPPRRKISFLHRATDCPAMPWGSRVAASHLLLGMWSTSTTLTSSPTLLSPPITTR